MSAAMQCLILTSSLMRTARRARSSSSLGKTPQTTFILRLRS
jgi:hypothetical protein